MDWDELAYWKIKDMEGNSIKVRETLFFAYYKARALDMRIAELIEVAPTFFELVDSNGTVVNSINKVDS